MNPQSFKLRGSYIPMGFPGDSDIKNLLTVRKTLVQFLDPEDTLEK